MANPKPPITEVTEEIDPHLVEVDVSTRGWTTSAFAIWSTARADDDRLLHRHHS